MSACFFFYLLMDNSTDSVVPLSVLSGSKYAAPSVMCSIVSDCIWYSLHLSVGVLGS